ncbi:unnamed protein product [Zymoseptoria tritici ST99CH_1A5]|uniref:F-box domain-containing protein n=1 Tax=Zymoseptoria tritici ST99CH_1A5 TaxID=1276529 RepID=A0A1Y6LPV8_ZYMTR|nr:unnamed protein product [Zymoseptoria tritici ST99CH_1A5]
MAKLKRISRACAYTFEPADKNRPAGTADFAKPTDTATNKNKDRLSALPKELRLDIYELLELPSSTYVVSYPLIAKTGPRSQPVLQVSSMIRKEAMPILYQDTRLIIKPRENYCLPTIPRAIARSTPSFANHVAFMQVVAIVRTPLIVKLPPGTQMWNTRFVFERSGNRATVKCVLIDPECWWGRDTLMDWMKARATEMKAVMVDHLQDNVAGKGKMLFEEALGFGTAEEWHDFNCAEVEFACHTCGVSRHGLSPF